MQMLVLNMGKHQTTQTEGQSQQSLTSTLQKCQGHDRQGKTEKTVTDRRPEMQQRTAVWDPGWIPEEKKACSGKTCAVQIRV